jgi:hypothetical protein
MHNSTPEYASTSSILKPFEKKFLKKRFSPQISLNPLSTQETKLKKERERKRKAPKVSSNEGEVNILRGEMNFNFKKILFDVISFSSPASYHFKNPFQNY